MMHHRLSDLLDSSGVNLTWIGSALLTIVRNGVTSLVPDITLARAAG
jgi:hypothetical protein